MSFVPTLQPRVGEYTCRMVGRTDRAVQGTHDVGDRLMVWIVVGVLAIAVLWCAVMLEDWVDRGDTST